MLHAMFITLPAFFIAADAMPRRYFFHEIAFALRQNIQLADAATFNEQ